MRAHACRDSIHACITHWWVWPRSGAAMAATLRPLPTPLDKEGTRQANYA